jgi:hypothetical protein
MPQQPNGELWSQKPHLCAYSISCMSWPSTLALPGTRAQHGVAAPLTAATSMSPREARTCTWSALNNVCTLAQCATTHARRPHIAALAHHRTSTTVHVLQHRPWHTSACCRASPSASPPCSRSWQGARTPGLHTEATALSFLGCHPWKDAAFLALATLTKLNQSTTSPHILVHGAI